MPKGNDIGTRVETFLGEFRMIIPAMAALLGFQLTMAFADAFQDLPPLEQMASFAALACTASAFLFLLVPASYHRFTLEFEETEEFLRFGRRSIGTAFVFMPLTLALTFYVQAVQVFGSRAVGAAVATVTLLACLAVWWAIPVQRARAKGYLPHDPQHRHVQRDARRGRPARARLSPRPKPSSSSRPPRREAPRQARR